MKIFEMRLEDLPFQATEEGKKIIEVRLNDDRRRNLKPGDLIRFLRASDNKPLMRKIREVRPYCSLQELVDNESLAETGPIYKSASHWYQEIGRYYSDDLQKKYGLIVIQLGEIDI